MIHQANEKETLRLEAFSDAVFAIAATLLVLEIKVPILPEGSGAWELGFAVIKVWPSFMAFAFSFLAILVIWANHHSFFSLVDKVNRPFIYANGLLLLMVTFLPFPTAVLAKYVETPAAKTATVFYCATFLFVNLAFNFLWWAAAFRRRIIRPEVAPQTLIRIRNAYGIGLPIYLCAMLVAFFNAWVALVLCSALWILWALLDYRSA
jgi:uncharacterized membrane protein